MAITNDSYLDTAAEEQASSPSLFAGIGRTLRLWRQRVTERDMLAHMSERDVRDMGMTESDVRFEMDKPFWRA